MTDAPSKTAKTKAAKTKPASDTPKSPETKAETVATPAPAAEVDSAEQVGATGSEDQHVNVIDAAVPAEGASPEVKGKQGNVILDEAALLPRENPVFVGGDLGRKEFPVNTPQVIGTTGGVSDAAVIVVPGWEPPLIRRFPVVCNVVANKKWIAPGNYVSVDRARFDELKASNAFVAETRWEDGEPDDGPIGGMSR
ncbi:MAG: hypothetical protein KF895_15260 [Parvibaculum sp.]|uniref:hypothetical protein n=1 Tax=Chelatococcus sp. TaxID=1953771 RepID=UPI001EC39721|nr:hypothetical protein [Chelatococcus sp.]MBX3506838.1 hypothetical protein [Parvibaculum sp.]MBX3545585.1 hypothetical protein [Chelatococcus sp.]